MAQIRLEIDNAPAKEIIPRIIEKGLFEDLQQFYQIRVDWHRYPLIHDRFVTYGLFHDLLEALPQDSGLVKRLLDFAIDIAEQEMDARFINSLFLVESFCHLACEDKIIDRHQISRIIALEDRVRKLSFIPNLSGFWENMLRSLSKISVIDFMGLLVRDNDYLKYLHMLFRNLDAREMQSCPVEFAQLEQVVAPIQGEYAPLRMVSGIAIGDTKYWVWEYKNITGNIWSFYISVRVDEKGQVNIERHSMHGGVICTPEKMVLKFHYA